jgi:hypothetical protein
MESGSACAASFCGYSRLRAQAGSWGGPKLAPVMRPAKVVPVSMADGESAEPLLEGSATSREHPASGQELQERQGERDG